MLTQMELMHNVVDLDRPISIHGEQIAETLIIRPMRSVSLSNLLSLFLSFLLAIVLSRDSHRQHLPTNLPTTQLATLCRYRERCIYEIVITQHPIQQRAEES